MGIMEKKMETTRMTKVSGSPASAKSACFGVEGLGFRGSGV